MVLNPQNKLDRLVLFLLLWLFQNFNKSGRFGLPPPKDRHCLLFSNWKCGYHIGSLPWPSHRPVEVNKKYHLYDLWTGQDQTECYIEWRKNEILFLFLAVVY